MMCAMFLVLNEDAKPSVKRIPRGVTTGMLLDVKPLGNPNTSGLTELHCR